MPNSTQVPSLLLAFTDGEGALGGVAMVWLYASVLITRYLKG